MHPPPQNILHNSVSTSDSRGPAASPPSPTPRILSMRKVRFTTEQGTAHASTDSPEPGEWKEALIMHTTTEGVLEAINERFVELVCVCVCVGGHRRHFWMSSYYVIHENTRTHTHTHTHKHIQNICCMHTHAHARTHAHTHTHRERDTTNTQTHIRIHIRTHTHTHAFSHGRRQFWMSQKASTSPVKGTGGEIVFSSAPGPMASMGTPQQGDNNYT